MGSKAAGSVGEIRLRGWVGGHPRPRLHSEKDRLVGAAGSGRRQAVPSIQPSHLAERCLYNCGIV